MSISGIKPCFTQHWIHIKQINNVFRFAPWPSGFPIKLVNNCFFDDYLLYWPESLNIFSVRLDQFTGVVKQY